MRMLTNTGAIDYIFGIPSSTNNGYEERITDFSHYEDAANYYLQGCFEGNEKLGFFYMELLGTSIP
jgi:hypothetical protein